MLEVFTEQAEVLIKDGVANLYWYKGDLHKAWIRSGIPRTVVDEISRLRREDGRSLSKRQQMDELYLRLRAWDYNRRLEVSRNFVRILTEQDSFTPQDAKHRVEVAEHCALKLRELVRRQEADQEHRAPRRARASAPAQESYDYKLGQLRNRFVEANRLDAQKRGYALETLFAELMRISDIPMEEPFRIVGEALDGAIKYDGHYYLLELKWTSERCPPKEIGHFFYKVEGKLGARGLLLSMNGFSEGAIASLPTGRELKVLLLDGQHLANVIDGLYSFQELLEHAIRQGSVRGEIYCAHDLRTR